MVEAVVEYSFQVVLYSHVNAQMMLIITVGNVAPWMRGLGMVGQ